METTFETIEKEFIPTLTFPREEVLTDRDAIKQRDYELEQALRLGNLEHTKFKIYFADNQSKKVVETTIWGVTDDTIILKKGCVIPKHRIYRSV